jgi:hypothetical protein
MYHGPQSLPVTYHYDRYRPGWGYTPSVKAITRETKHVYTCDTCGQRYAFTAPAEEPFYCRCQELVSIA